MSDPAAAIPLQNPSLTDQNVACIQVTVNGAARLVEFCLPGHPLIARTEWVATAAHTNASLIAAAGAGIRTTVTQLSIFLHSDVTVHTNVRVGFGASLPAEAAPGTVGAARILLNHRFAPGGGVVLGSGTGAVGQSSANSPMVITSTVPTTGKLAILASYFQPEFA